MRRVIIAAIAVLFSAGIASACTWGAAKTASSEDPMTEQSQMSTFDGLHLPPIEAVDEEAGTIKSETGDPKVKPVE